MSALTTELNGTNGSNGSAAVAPMPEERKGLTKKEVAADHPTWCPGCGDFSVLALYFKLIEKRKMWHEKITTVAGIGCSSRFPYFVQAHGAHFIHGRALPFASGISLSRPDLHVFVFGGDGDAFSIGGNHFNHTARKNIKMTYVVMDNWVYGLTKKQTSPTSPLGFKSKTDQWGAIDYPINPMKQAIAAGATFVARTTHTNPNHVLQMMEAAMDHDGFSFIECLSECVEFYEGAFDASNPRKGGVFHEVPKDHDVTNEAAAYQLRGRGFPRPFRHLLQDNQADQERQGGGNPTGHDGETQRLERLANSPEKFRADEVRGRRGFQELAQNVLRFPPECSFSPQRGEKARMRGETAARLSKFFACGYFKPEIRRTQIFNSKFYSSSPKNFRLASSRVWTPSFLKSGTRWVWTVPGEIPRCWAISLSERLEQRCRMICCSRAVRPQPEIPSPSPCNHSTTDFSVWTHNAGIPSNAFLMAETMSKEGMGLIK